MFNSIFLSSMPKDKALTENVLKKDPVSTYMEAIFEHNFEMQTIDVDEKINYYRSLKEQALNESTSLVVHEGIISGVRDFIAKAIQAIIDFIKKIVGLFRGAHDKNARRDYETNKSAIRRGNAIYSDKKYNFIFYHIPYEIDDSCIRAASQNITMQIDNICNGSSVDADNSLVETAYKAMVRLISRNRSRNTYNETVINHEMFKAFITADMIWAEKKEATVKEFADHYFDTSKNPLTEQDTAKCLDAITKELERCRNRVKNADNIGADQRENAQKLVAMLDSLVKSWTWYCNEIVKKTNTFISYANKAANKFTRNVKESASIHGETFDGDTLFTNDDINDFNPTEWMDLELTAECYAAASEMLEFRRNVACLEASIMAENSADTWRKLIAMREEAEEKAGNKIQNILATIKRIINEFINKLIGGNKLHLKYLNDNKETIAKPFNFTSNLIASGDVFNGAQRVQTKSNFSFDYNRMKECDSDRAVFEKFMLSSMNSGLRQGLKWDDEISISEYCKGYFGGKMPKDKYPEITIPADKVNGSKDEMIRFINNAKAIQATVKAELSKLEADARQVLGSTMGQAAASAQADNADTKQESMYYSYLYDRWFTEAEFEGGSEEKNNEGNAGTASGNAESKDNGEKDKAAAFKNYMNACKAVMLAKATATEFITNEFMWIIKQHVSKNGPKKKATADGKGNAEPAAEENK